MEMYLSGFAHFDVAVASNSASPCHRGSVFPTGLSRIMIIVPMRNMSTGKKKRSRNCPQKTILVQPVYRMHQTNETHLLPNKKTVPTSPPTKQQQQQQQQQQQKKKKHSPFTKQKKNNNKQRQPLPDQGPSPFQRSLVTFKGSTGSTAGAIKVSTCDGFPIGWDPSAWRIIPLRISSAKKKLNNQGQLVTAHV